MQRSTAAMRLAEELGLRPLVTSCQSSLGSLDVLAGEETSASRRRHWHVRFSTSWTYIRA